MSILFLFFFAKAPASLLLSVILQQSPILPQSNATALTLRGKQAVPRSRGNAPFALLFVKLTQHF